MHVTDSSSTALIFDLMSLRNARWVDNSNTFVLKKFHPFGIANEEGSIFNVVYAVNFNIFLFISTCGILKCITEEGNFLASVSIFSNSIYIPSPSFNSFQKPDYQYYSPNYTKFASQQPIKPYVDLYYEMSTADENNVKLWESTINKNKSRSFNNLKLYKEISSQNQEIENYLFKIKN